MKFKEINVNDLVAVSVAGLVVIVAIITKVEEPIIPVVTGFLGLVGGYVGSRLLNDKSNSEDEL